MFEKTHPKNLEESKE